MRRIPFFAPIVTMTLMAGTAFAQQTSGDLVGTVKDPSGAIIPNAAVVVTNEETGVKANTLTGSAGEYRVSNLLPGRYDIVVNAPGFQRYDLKGVTVTLNATATANIAVSLGTSQSVEVTAESGVVLDTTSANLTTTFSNAELANLPTATVGFGVLNAALLSPGVASTGGIGIGEGPSVGGQRPRNNNFELEGIDNNDKGVTGPLVYVPNDAVGSFTLITNQFSPEFGHSSGGQFNTNVLSGTNQFHGRLYEYFQNRDLNAGQGTALTKPATRPRFDFNRYGGQLGGPIFRDKLFFFGNFERQTTGQNLNINVCTPTAAGLTTLQGLGATYGLSANNLAAYIASVPAATAFGGAQVTAANDAACFDQATGGQFLTIFQGTALTNGVYGSGASTNIPLGNFVANPGAPSNFDALTTSMDYNLSAKDQIRGRYVYNTEGAVDTAASLPSFYTTEPFRYHLVALSEFHTFSPNLTNEFRLGYNRYQTADPAGNFNFPGLPVFPNITIAGDQNFLNIGPDGNAPQTTTQNLYQVVDNISYAHGKNTFTIGFDGRKYISPQTFTQRLRGDYEYDALTEYLHDLAPTYFGERSTGNQVYYGDQTALYGYGNDTYRATSQLTFNFGLRYEFTSVPVGERAQALNAIASVPGVLTFGAPQPGYKNFAPRLGVEFAPDSRTSIRAGFGIAYDVLFDNLGLLSFPPEYSSTLDVGSTGPAYGSPNFLANGGLPQGGVGIKTYTSQTAAANATSAYVPNQVLPYAESYTLTVQRTFGNYTAEVGYVGTRGIHLPTQDQINVQVPVTAANQLPTSLTGPSVVTAAPGASTLAKLQGLPYIVPAYANAGFTSKITSYQPYSESNYNGLVTNITRRLSNGLQLNISYTYSKTMDDATAEVFSTVLTPRREQDSQNIAGDYSRSALDRTNRATVEVLYNFNIFKTRNYLLKNIASNWTFSPIYTYESPEYATVLSGVNSNLNTDSAGIDRTIINPFGVKGTASNVTPQYASNLAGLCPAGQTRCAANLVGYVAANPNAYYIQAGQGTLPNGARNTLPTLPTDNLDFTALKRLTFFEHYNFEFGAQAFNVLNHAEYTPGSVDTINATGTSTLSTQFQTAGTSALTPNPAFNQANKVFQNHGRTMQLSAKISF